MKNAVVLAVGFAAVAVAAYAIYTYGKKKHFKVGCGSDADCGAGSKCYMGVCVTQPCGGKCPQGTKCVNEQCVTSGKCGSSEHCPDGTVCINERCVSPIQTDCKSNMDCSLGYGCTPDGACVSPGSVACVGEGSNCPSGWQCVNLKCEPRLVPRSGPSTFWDD